MESYFWVTGGGLAHWFAGVHEVKYISVIYGLSVAAMRLVSEAPRRIRVHRVCALKLSLAVSKLGESALILSH